MSIETCKANFILYNLTHQKPVIKVVVMTLYISNHLISVHLFVYITVVTVLTLVSYQWLKILTYV